MALNERLFVVTGAAAGIGAEICARLLSDGANIIGIDATASCADRYEMAVVGDVGDPATWRQCTRMCAEIGPIDGLVNCAGIALHGSVRNTSLNDWNRTISANLTGCFLSVRELLAQMRTPGASVVNVASTLGLTGAADLSAYCASKGGVINLTRALAVELGPVGIRVNCVCPGPIDTEFLDGSDGGFGPRELLAKRTALQRLGSVQEVADLVLFLLSDSAAFMTGTAVPVDGGKLAR